MINVGILGTSGYTGFELLSILEKHPKIELKIANANTHAGKKIKDLYPNYSGKREYFDGFDINEVVNAELDCVFLALPNGLAMKLAPKLMAAGTKVIDLSADYRFEDPIQYENVYKITHEDKQQKAVYGLSELFRKEIKNATLIANPGCYPTASVLLVYPLVEVGLVDYVIFDSKSGYSGAGREKTENEEYQKKIRDNIIAYNLVVHRHLSEMRQFLGNNVSFTPHVLSCFRGMMTTAHVILKKQVEKTVITSLYEKKYVNESFVKVVDHIPDLHSVQNTNNCIIGGFERDDNKRIVIVGVIDNLLKGASGQAVQNMNIMFGFDEGEGLV